jgi:hypothetical protein
MNGTKKTLLYLISEAVIYIALVSVYLALVLHFLVGWLKELFTKEPTVYAFVAILLMIAQAIGMERMASALVHVAGQRRNK